MKGKFLPIIGVVAISLITISYLGIHHKRTGAGFTAIGHYENDRGKEGPPLLRRINLGSRSPFALMS